MTKTTTKRQRKKRLRADDPLTALRKATKRLDKEQGAVARRNGRSAVFAEIRRLKAFVDKEFPVIRTQSSKSKRKRREGMALFDHLLKTGWRETTNRVLLAAASEAGIKAKQVSWWHTTKVKGAGHKGTYIALPSWVEQLWSMPNATVSMLRKARRSKVERDALLMEEHFRQQKAANDA